jgi:chemotaxis protein MotA
MDKTSIIGILLAVIAVGVGMVYKGVSLDVLINPAALLIILLGTAAAVIIAFPANEIKRIPKLFGVLFTDKKILK